jgi:hypothetical protein
MLLDFYGTWNFVMVTTRICHRLSSSCQQKFVIVIVFIKSFSFFSFKKTVIVIVTTKMCYCHKAHINLPLFFIVSTKIFYYLSSCLQKSVIICHRVHKNLSLFVIKSTKICHCSSQCQQKSAIGQ